MRVRWDAGWLPARAWLRRDQAFFTSGQRFTIWADAVVGDTIRACGVVGDGVIARPARRCPAAAATPSGP
jgi:hypothetical protein